MRAFTARAAFSQRDSASALSPPPSPSQPQQPNKISPAVLFIIVILAIIFFISGLLHLLVRLLIKKQPNSSPDRSTEAGPDTIQRQLQQLFHLHDSGLDQTIIDSLPVFLYEEILGPKEPFDCAVCLCEFLKEDKLRLLPGCGHAFHLDCIDTWLLSNSTCPLCRGSLGVMVENTNFLFENPIEEDSCRDDRDAGKLEEEKIVFSIRLGKFRNVSKTENANDAGEIRNASKEIGDASSSNLDARRCLSMGSYQYVLANSSLQVACTSSVKGRSMRFVNNAARNEMPDERKISASTRGESLSVSKIWQRSGQRGDIRGNSSSQGKSILVRLPVMEEKGGDP